MPGDVWVREDEGNALPERDRTPQGTAGSRSQRPPRWTPNRSPIRRRPGLLRYAVVLAASLLMTVCNAIQPLGDSNNSVLVDRAWIGPEGGSLQVSGATLSIPPDVLEEELLVELSWVDITTLPELPRGFVSPISSAYRISPVNTALFDSDSGFFSLSIDVDDDGFIDNDTLLFTVDGCDRWMNTEALSGAIVRQRNTDSTPVRLFGTFVFADYNGQTYQARRGKQESLTGNRPCIFDEQCFVEACFWDEEEEIEECEPTEDNGFCGYDGFCRPFITCACFEEEPCAPYRCRVSSSLPEACLGGLGTLLEAEDDFFE
ncbi:MAG: hypothetical protein AAFX99_17150 [Myxococcota bacterium]